jgi:hypothetical protein
MRVKSKEERRKLNEMKQKEGKQAVRLLTKAYGA